MFNSGRQQRMETGIAAMWKPSPGISSERSTAGDVIRIVAAVPQGAARPQEATNSGNGGRSLRPNLGHKFGMSNPYSLRRGRETAALLANSETRLNRP